MIPIIPLPKLIWLMQASAEEKRAFMQDYLTKLPTQTLLEAQEDLQAELRRRGALYANL